MNGCIEIPRQPGAYRWWYFDVSAGDFTAVFIFMIGSIFSAKYSASYRRGAMPAEHSAVNFALYEKGVRRSWVLSEYPAARVSDDGNTLRIGGSQLSYDSQGRVTASVKERAAVWGAPVDVQMTFKPEAATTAPIRLVDDASHYWHPIAPIGTASVTMPMRTFTGAGYHDGNFGEVPLGTDCRGWQWVRSHLVDATRVTYQPWGGSPGIRLLARDSTVVVSREPLLEGRTKKTLWGLPVPRSLDGAAAPRLIESSPFYARLEAHSPYGSVLGEVADFERFHRPTIRWMARLRTRSGEALR